MKPSTLWIGMVLLAVGVCGILDATGVVDSSQTIGQWWPLALVGWALSEMLSVHQVTLGGAICVAVGITLLADVQAWASDGTIWSILAAFAGVAILVNASLGRGARHNGDDGGSVAGGAS